MNFGSRRIRSAGRTSGSVEVTLPPQLHSLLEIECRLSLRDGTYPEIVLQPDLSAAHGLLPSIWRQIQAGLAPIGDVCDFDPSAFTLALFPPRHWQQRPPLSYADALATLRQAPDGREALARLLASMGGVAGAQLGLGEQLAAAFGDAVAYLVTGTAALAGYECERGFAQRLAGIVPPAQADPQPFERLWPLAAPGIVCAWPQFAEWQAAPERYATARKNWHCALLIDMGSALSRSLKPSER